MRPNNLPSPAPAGDGAVNPTKQQSPGEPDKQGKVAAKRTAELQAMRERYARG